MAGDLRSMEYVEMENLLLALEKLIEELRERVEELDNKLASGTEALQSQINNSRD